MRLEWLVDKLKQANRMGVQWDEAMEDDAPVMRPSKSRRGEDEDDDDEDERSHGEGSTAGEEDEEPLSDTDSEPHRASSTSCALCPPCAASDAAPKHPSSVSAVISHDSSSCHVRLPVTVTLSSMQDVIMDVFPGLSSPVLLSYEVRDDDVRIISTDRELTKAILHMQDSREGLRLQLTTVRGDRKRAHGRRQEKQSSRAAARTHPPRTDVATSDDSEDEQQRPSRSKRQRTPAHTQALPPKLSPPVVPSVPKPCPPPVVATPSAAAAPFVTALSAAVPSAVVAPIPLSTVWLEVVEGTSPRCVVSRFLVSLPLLSTFEGLRRHLQGVGLCGGREWGFEVKGSVLQESEEGETMEAMRVEAGYTIRLVKRKEAVEGPAALPPLVKLGKAEEEAVSAISSLAHIFISSREAQQAEAGKRRVGEVEAACA